MPPTPSNTPWVPKDAAQENARRKKRQNFKLPQIEQEIAWRKWFPAELNGVDFSQDLNEEDARRAHTACISFLEETMWIKVPGKGRIPFKMRQAQKDVLWEWIRFRRTVALKARQVGFSTLVSGFSLWLAFGWGDRLIIMLSRGEREAVSLLRKAKDAYKNMPEWVKLRGPKLLDRTRQVMTFENESCIQSLPSASEPGRGESVFMVVVDEWAFLPNPEEAWAAIEPITDIGGRVVGLSTAKGEGNFFHRLWLGSQNGTNSFTGIFHPWWAVDERDENWYAAKKRDLEPWQLAQEYPSNPEEAFVGSGNPFFSLENLRRFTPEQPIFEGRITRDGRKPELIDGDGPLTIWEMPNDEQKYSYAIGADVAEGLEHGDFSVAYVLCVQTNEIVAIWYGHVDPDIFGFEILPALGWLYRYAVIGPEFNNHGMTVVRGLQRAKYGRIYRRRTLSRRQDRPLEQLGWLTTATSKPFLADELGAWLRECPNIPDANTVAELRSFSRDAKGKLSGQPHDDRVMALGITVQVRKYAITERIAGGVAPEKMKGSFAWWESKLKGGSERRRRQHPTMV